MEKYFSVRLIDALDKNSVLSTQEIYELFSDMNKQTVSWHLHKMLEKGKIIQIKHGFYSISKTEEEDRNRISLLPFLSQTAYQILEKTGYNFYLSGLDALTGRGFQISGAYPVIICTDTHRVKDIQLELMRESDFAITEDDLLLLDNPIIKSKIQYVILKTNAFCELSKNHFAFVEKAFVDLYYAVTRLDYPLNIEELPHILSLIKPNEYKYKLSTKDRGLSDELNFLLNYDKRFISSLDKYIN